VKAGLHAAFLFFDNDHTEVEEEDFLPGNASLEA
jgi:hypothetical protein